MASRHSPVFGSNAGRARSHNRRVVLGCLRAGDPLGRSEIAGLSGLSVQAVSNIIAELERDGYLRAAGRKRAGRGQPPVQYRLDPEGASALGLEIRPDAIVSVLVDLTGRVRHTAKVPLDRSDPPTAAAAAAYVLADALAAAGRARSTLLGSGVVMPGPFNVEGLGRAGRAVLEGWEASDPRQVFAAALGTSVVIENDATAAAVAERVRGVAGHMRTFCFLYFGTGLGLGVISAGQPQTGAFGNAGEIGHVVIEPGGRPCDCGNRGCLETYASLMAVRGHMAMRGVLVRDGADLAALLADRDPDLLAWLAIAAPALSQAIGLIENIFDPEAVILGGALPDALIDDLIARLDLPRGTVAVRAERRYRRVLRGASGDLTAAFGAAALVLNDAMTPRLHLARPET